MSNVVEYASFKLKEGVSVPDFLLASDKMNDEFLSPRNGYIYRKLLVDGDMWVDLVLWETMDDAQNAANAFGENEVGREYISFIDMIDFHHFTIEKSY